MSINELDEFMVTQFPQAAGSATIVRLDEEQLELHQPFRAHMLRPGGTISGPTLMALADHGAYLLILSRIGPVALAVTTNLSINFMRKPKAEDVRAEFRMLKLGRRLAVVEARIMNANSPALVAHATVTYAIPPAPHG